MWIKIIALLTAGFQAIPQIKEIYLRWLEERAKKKLADALSKVDSAKSKEDIKNAVSDAARVFNKRD